MLPCSWWGLGRGCRVAYVLKEHPLLDSVLWVSLMHPKTRTAVQGCKGSPSKTLLEATGAPSSRGLQEPCGTWLPCPTPGGKELGRSSSTGGAIGRGVLPGYVCSLALRWVGTGSQKSGVGLHGDGESHRAAGGHQVCRCCHTASTNSSWSVPRASPFTQHLL